MKETTVRKLAILLLILLAVSLLPVLWVCQYDYPATDDLYFAAPTRHTFLDTHSGFAVLATACRNTVDTYLQYQGTFSAVFLWNLMPGIWGDQFYGVGAAFLVLAFVLSHLFFFRTVLPRLGFDRWRALLLSAAITAVCMQFTHSPREAFFWFNGAVYYNFFYCLMLVFFALLIRYTGGGVRFAPVYWALLPLLSLCLGATNYSVALMFGVVYTAAVLYLCCVRKARPLHFVALGCFFVALLLSAVSPGNALRASMITSGTGVKLPPLSAILQSILYSAKQCAMLLTPQLLACLLLCMPVLYRAAKASGLRFRCPILVTVGSVLLLAVGYTPPMYLLQKVSSLRLISIMQYLYILLLFLNAYCYLGWLARLERSRVEHAIRLLGRVLPAYFALCLALLAFGSIRNGKYKEYLSVACLGTTITGNAPAYAEEMAARSAVLNDEHTRDAVLEPLAHTPWLLYAEDLQADPTYFLNVEAAIYYRKDSIRIDTDDVVGE